MAERSSRTLQELIDLLLPALNGVRQRRKYIENEWLENYRAWQGWPTPEYMMRQPNNTIHYFIPHLRRAVEKNVKRATKLLMPNMDWLQTLPFDGRSHENAEAVHNVMRYIYQKKLPTKRNISSVLRCIQLYNFGGLETSVLIDNNEVWPYQRAFDPFNFYIFPDNAANVQEAVIVFEDSIIPYQVYRSYVNRDNPSKSIYKNINADDLTTPLWPYHLIERLAYRGLTNPSDYMIGDTGSFHVKEEVIERKRDEARRSREVARNFVSLTRCYFRMGSEWNFAVFCNNIKGSGDNKYNTEVVRLDDTERNPMYEWCTTRPLPGEVYTNSATDDLRVLQNLCNAALSQVESNRAIFAEPPLGVDMNQVGRLEEMTFGNRKIWKFNGPPKDIIQTINVENTMKDGLIALSSYKGLLDESSGGGLPEGRPGRNAPRAGFAANTYLNMSLIDIEDSADTVEQEILTPSAGHVYHCILEYVPSAQIIRIPNKSPDLVQAYKRRDLYGDFSFSWIGALGFQDNQQRADKFMQLFQTLLNPQVLQILGQQLASGKMKLDLVGLLKTIYSYGIGERGLGDLVIPMTEEEIASLNKPPPEVVMEQQKMQQELQMKAADAQTRQQEGQQKLQFEQQKSQLSLRELQAKSAASAQQVQIKTQSEAQKTALQQQQLQMKARSEAQKLALDTQRAGLDHQSRLSQIGLKNREMEMNARFNDEKRRQALKKPVGRNK